jgi:hypothetical protein
MKIMKCIDHVWMVDFLISSWYFGQLRKVFLFKTLFSIVIKYESVQRVNLDLEFEKKNHIGVNPVKIMFDFILKWYYFEFF